MRTIGIRTEAAYRAALERIAELAETAPDSEELAALVAETSAWEAAPRTGQALPGVPGEPAKD